jgi:DUF1680 family protein
MATINENGIQIHMYNSAAIEFYLPSIGRLKLELETRGPWEGSVAITVLNTGPLESSSPKWELALRVPSWSYDCTVRINGVNATVPHDPGSYVRLHREWSQGDTVVLDFGLKPRLIEAHPYVEAARGCVAIARGPLVYCLEGCDQAQDIQLLDYGLDTIAPLISVWERDLLGGVVTVSGYGSRIDKPGWEKILYRTARESSSPPRSINSAREELKAIPYFAWANREKSPMTVWIPKAVDSP